MNIRHSTKKPLKARSNLKDMTDARKERQLTEERKRKRELAGASQK